MAARLRNKLDSFRKAEAESIQTVEGLRREQQARAHSRKPPATGKRTPAQLAQQEPPKPAQPKTERKAPLAKLVKDVLDCIIEAERGLGIDELERMSAVNIRSDPELHQLLEKHERIQVQNGIWQYKAKHDAKNKEELFRLIMAYPEGILASELDDAYNGVAEDIKKLKDEKRVIMIQQSDNGQQDVLFPCNPEIDVRLDEDILQLWNESFAKIDLEHFDAELKKAGLKPYPRKEKSVVDLTQKKERKKRKRQQRVFTNAHMLETPKE